MHWFYVRDGQRNGPVTETQLDELIHQGTIQGETLIWREGQTDWQPLRIARASTGQPAPGIPPLIASTACVECRRVFPQSEMVLLNRSWVCAQCKPLFLQRLTEGAAMPGAGAWRFKRQMVVRSETVLPDRCVLCNASSAGFRLQRKLYWHHPAFYLLILINLLVYAIVALCVRKKAAIHIGLCETHRARRKNVIIGSWVVALAGIAMLAAGIAGYGATLGWVGVILLLGGALFGAIKGPVVAAAKIDKDMAWVKGAREPFLATLPEWTGP